MGNWESYQGRLINLDNVSAITINRLGGTDRFGVEFCLGGDTWLTWTFPNENAANVVYRGFNAKLTILREND